MNEEIEVKGNTVEEVSQSITDHIMKENRATRYQNELMRKMLREAGIEPPGEDPNYESLVKAIQTAQDKEESIEGKESKFKAEVYRDAATYCIAAQRRGDVRYNEACTAIRTTLLALAEEFDPTPPTPEEVA